jgi:hypothetical protein
MSLELVPELDAVALAAALADVGAKFRAALTACRSLNSSSFMALATSRLLRQANALTWKSVRPYTTLPGRTSPNDTT